MIPRPPRFAFEQVTCLLFLSVSLLASSAVHAADLAIGDPAPDFELPATDGRVYRLADMAGDAVVLAWFPRALTQGCTIECKSLVEHGDLLREYRVHYFMASVDPLETNMRFAADTEADFPMLSDESRAVAAAYGVLGEFGVARRHNFYIGPDGRILAIDRNVQPATAAPDIAQKLAQLGVPRHEATRE
jgi:thioredoxin-dependent peroxiredoxin